MSISLYYTYNYFYFFPFVLFYRKMRFQYINT